MAKIRCKNCTHENHSNAKYCKKCNIPLDESKITFRKSFEVIFGDNNHLLMDEGEYVIGRSKQADITVSNDKFISGEHAVLKIKEGNLYLEDLGSKNGTLINDYKLSSGRKKINLSDTFICGQTKFQILPQQ